MKPQSFRPNPIPPMTTRRVRRMPRRMATAALEQLSQRAVHTPKERVVYAEPAPF